MENTLIKTVANMQYLARMAGPHDALFAPGYHTVNSLRAPVDRWLSAPADYSRLALHHYAIKSRQDFASKAARGDSMSDEGKIVEDFWERIEAGCACTRINLSVRCGALSHPAPCSCLARCQSTKVCLRVQVHRQLHSWRGDAAAVWVWASG